MALHMWHWNLRFNERMLTVFMLFIQKNVVIKHGGNALALVLVAIEYIRRDMMFANMTQEWGPQQVVI